MSSYLMFRYVYDPNKAFTDKQTPLLADLNFPRVAVTNAGELMEELKTRTEAACLDAKGGGGAALALSGGIDSAILAKFMPEGSTAYTFRCVVPGKKVIDETEKAKIYADKCHLNHKIVNITWEDVDSITDVLMKRKGAPIHSIETQIYLAALQAKKDGFSKLILGENADIIYGGMNGLLAKDWSVGEFVDRYSYVLPYKVLKSPQILMKPFLKFSDDGKIDAHAFINEYFRQEALGTYNNACKTADVKFVGPYSMTNFTPSLNYERIRSGDTKYVIREVFRKLYPDVDELPPKIPMPRPVNEWMTEHYKEGPKRSEFIPHCIDDMTGDQKWMVYCLERFLNLFNIPEG